MRTGLCIPSARQSASSAFSRIPSRGAACCHIPHSPKPELQEGTAPREQCREHAFEFDVARTRYGRGVLSEAGATARNMGLRRVAVVTDQVQCGTTKE